MKSQATVTFSLDGSAEGTEVTWAMVGKATTMTRMMGIFKSMDSLVGPDRRRPRSIRNREARASGRI